ncbi:MAG: helix-turn-helix domain-containing protein, partial [Actinomycetes bacterium]
MLPTMAEPVLEGMPAPESLRVLTHEGETVVLSGRLVLFRFALADVGMRRLAMVALTQAGQSVKTVATAFEVHPNYLSTLRKTAREEGSAGLVKVQGRPAKLTPAQLARARGWAGQGVSGREIARRLQVSESMISRLVGAGRATPDPELPDPELPDVDAESGLVVTEPVATEPEPPVEAVSEHGEGLGSSRLVGATVDSRYAGAMLLHAFFDRVGAAAVFGSVTGPRPGSQAMLAGSRRFDDMALLTATGVAFALGVGSM